MRAEGGHGDGHEARPYRAGYEHWVWSSACDLGWVEVRDGHMCFHIYINIQYSEN